MLQHHRFIVRSLAVVATTVFFIVSGSGSASAAVLNFDANLDGLQVSPPNASPAFGLAELSLDTTSGAVNVLSGSYSSLLGGSIAASLNGMAAPGSNAGVLIALTLDTPGSATGTFSGSGTLAPMAIAGMQAGNTYLLIRSQVFPSGEIRGQLFPAPTPEPNTCLLMAIAATGCTACRRRRQS